jgi:hypothetical protein
MRVCLGPTSGSSPTLALPPCPLPGLTTRYTTQVSPSPLLITFPLATRICGGEARALSGKAAAASRPVHRPRPARLRPRHLCACAFSLEAGLRISMAPFEGIETKPWPSLASAPRLARHSLPLARVLSLARGHDSVGSRLIWLPLSGGAELAATLGSRPIKGKMMTRQAGGAREIDERDVGVMRQGCWLRNVIDRVPSGL